MVYFYYYCAFAVATGVTAYITIYRPALIRIRDEFGGSYVNDYPILTAVILTALCTVTAPLVLKAAIFGPSEELKEKILTDLADD